MNKFLWSNIAIIFGALCLVAGITNPTNFNIDLGIAGAVVILGVLAYKSAKKRKAGLVKNNISRIILEIAAIIITFLIIFLKKDIWDLMYYHPWANTIIPIWVWVAYFIMISSKQKVTKSVEK